MPVSEGTFLQLALEEPNRWELHCGRLVKRPGMSAQHNEVSDVLAFRLREQLDWNQFRARAQAGHVRRTSENYFIPDVFVIPTELFLRLRDRPNVLESYDAPLPLVVEVWSPSTGDYDADTKIPEYQRRGDLEIWRIHPFDRTLIAWRRQPDGSYVESLHTGETIQPLALPGVTIDLDTLFD